MIERIKALSLELIDTVSKTGLRVSDEVILTIASKLYVSENIQNQKTKQPIKEELATDKQLSYLNKLRIIVNKDLTKREAMDLIKKAKIQ